MRDILRVNMTDLSTSWEPLPEGWALYGGRALTDAIVYNEVPADSDPLGPANALGVLARHARRDDGPQRRSSVRRRQEPAHRRHQGVELGRPGRALAGSSRHRGRRRHRQARRCERPLRAHDRGRPHRQARARRRVGRSGQLRDRRRHRRDPPRGRPLRDRHERSRRRGARQGLRHRHLRPQGLPEPLRRSRWPGRRDGQQGPQGHHRLRQGRKLPRARRQGRVRRGFEALHDRAQGARRVRHRPADVRHQRADQHPVRGRRPADPQLLLGDVRVR